MLFSFCCHQKTIKSKQALHEIIRASSFSIIFVEFSFRPVYPTMVLKNFKFMENYNYWKMYFQVKILTLDVFNHMLQLSPIFPIAPAVTVLLQVLSSPLRQRWLRILGSLYFIWFVIFQMWWLNSFVDKISII